MHARSLPLVALTFLAFLAARAPSAQAQATAMGTLAEHVPDLVDRVEHSVVQIFATRSGASTGNPALVFTRQTSTGAGVIVDPRGYIVTNHHVVEGARRLQVVLNEPLASSPDPSSVLEPTGRRVGAQLVGADFETDIAVLKIDAGEVSALPFGDSESVRQGQLVFAFGSPRGLSGSVSMGVVSAVARQFADASPMIYIQSDVAVNPGNSGGPLVDVEGRVVGINSFIVTNSGGSEGLSFSVPSNIVRTIYEQIRDTGRVRRGVIGVLPQTITPLLASGLGIDRRWGVVLGDVLPGGPAEAAGLRAGDVILTLDGKTMENARQLQVNLYGKPIGRPVRVEFLRDGRQRAVEVTVLERPDDLGRLGDFVEPREAEVERLGILALDLDDALRSLFGGTLRTREGVVVAVVLFDLGVGDDVLLAGDVIRSVNGQQVKTRGQLRRAVDALAVGSAAVLQIERGGRLLYVPMRIDS